MVKANDDKYSVVLAIARRLVQIRRGIIPINSKREQFYHNYIRPILVKVLSISPPSKQRLPDIKIETYRNRRLNKDDIRNILIIKCDHIGDFILSLQAFTIIRSGFPAAHITLLCGPWNKTTAQASGLFDRIECLEVFNEISSISATPFAPEKIAKFNFGVFDIAIDLRADLGTCFLMNYIKANFKAGFAPSAIESDTLLDFAFAVPPSKIAERSNHARYNQTLLSSFAHGIVNFFEGNTFKKNNLAQLFKQGSTKKITKKGRGPMIGINTGSGNAIKNWPIRYYADLAKLISDQMDGTIVLIGSARQKPDSEVIRQNIDESKIIDLMGGDLNSISGVIEQLDLYIGNDSGITHLASIMEKPTICLHSGVMPLEGFGPIGNNTMTIKCVNLPCYPCGQSDIAQCYNEHQCMISITPEIVMQKIRELITPSFSMAL